MSVSSRRESSSTSKWWSLSSKASPASSSKQTNPPKDAPSSGKVASGSKFNTLASAIGFKSRKHPVLAIQEPPYLPRTASFANVSPVIEVALQHERNYANRPPSKSVSSIKSPVESIEPVTPVEPVQHHNHRHHRQSLFTLSDQDPFASHGMNTVADPTRLSVYSGSSGSDYVSKKAGIQRTSYASSSFSSAGDQLSPSARWQEPSPVPKLKPRRSQGSLHRKVSILSAESTLTSAWESLTHSAKHPTSSSPAAASDPHRLSQPPPNPLPRPPMRARGMTDTGMRQPSFLPSEPSSSSSVSSSSLVPSPSRRMSPTFSPPTPGLRQKQSSTRMGGPPPSAPPTHDLPLPPALVDGATADDDSDILPDISTCSTSSSGLSFASSISSNRDTYFAHSRKPSLEEQPDHSSSRQKKRKQYQDKYIIRPPPIIAPQPLPSPLSSPQTLKRALSHQSLGKRRTSASSIAPGPATDTPLDKAPRKQRSYPRIPVPPIPQSLRHATSFGPTAPLPSAPTSTQRTSSSHGLPPTRGRLFSGPTLRRPSTSQCTPVDDDIRSVFSLPLEQERMQGLSFSRNMPSTSSAAQSTSPPRSSWDCNSIDEPSSPATSSVADYTPRRIKSPAELLKIEASVHEAGLSYVRARGLSFTSVSTTMSDLDDFSSISAPHSPPTSIHLLPTLPPHTGSPLRSASMINKAPPVPRLQVRPSTSQATISPPSSPTSASSPRSQLFFPATSFQPVPNSLPPPPRPRPLRPSTAPLAPPPEPPVSTFVRAPRVVPLAPPPRRKDSMPKLSSDRFLQRRSVLRKPSFLEIDDDIDKDEPGGIEDSFLDLARESFDTVRTIDE